MREVMGVLFIVGLQQLTREERVELVAQLNCLTGTNILIETIREIGKRTSSMIGSLGNTVKSVRNKNAQNDGQGHHQKCLQIEMIREQKKRIISLNEKITEEYKRLLNEKDDIIDGELKKHLHKIVDRKKERLNDNELACAIIHRAAKSLKIDHEIYADATSLEGKVFEKAVEELIEILQKNLKNMTDDQVKEFEKFLRYELEKLSNAQQEAIKKSMCLEELSSQAMVKFFKTTAATAIAQLIIGSVGFNAFLFLTTAIKAFSLLVGVTVSPAVYIAATSLLSFMLSLPFLLIISFLAGSFTFKLTNKKIDGHLAKTLVMIGRSKLLLPSS